MKKFVSQDEITQIRVGEDSIGIIGLRAVMEEVGRECGDRPDQEVAKELRKRLSKRNYIPQTAKEEYETAFLREFRRFLGKPVKDELFEGLDVKILGPGCAQCDRLEQELMQVMAETGIAAGIERVRNARDIGSYGVMGTPALLINGAVKSVGRVPARNKLAKWLKESRKL